MRTSVGIYFFVLFFIISSPEIYSQECNAVPFMKKGTKLEYTQYTKKGKKEGTTTHETLSVTLEKNKLSALIQASVKDKNGTETLNTNYKAYCSNGLLSLDMLRFFNFNKLTEYDKNDLTLKIEGDVLEFPIGMQPGNKLNDGNITIKVNSQNFTLVTMKFKIFNRRVISEETISNPSGSYLCQKVTFDFESKFGIINVKGTGVEWYYKDALVIRSESYNKKGKLLGYHELTKVYQDN